MSKSKIACRFSIDTLLAGCVGSYMWTFTTPKKYPVRLTALMWGELSRNLVRSLGFRGVRVFELHPGGHGLHIHVITDKRYNVNSIRHYSRMAGFGRIDVSYKHLSGADYVSKYLGKQHRPKALKGLRLWQCLGFSGSKVKDIVLDSRLSLAIKTIGTRDILRYFPQLTAEHLENHRIVNWLKYLIAYDSVNSGRVNVRLGDYLVNLGYKAVFGRSAPGMPACGCPGAPAAA